MGRRRKDAGSRGGSLKSALHCASPSRRRFMNASGPRFLLTMLGGFLGAGKTTWLRHHLHSGVFRDAIVVVNEAASASVDHVLLGSANRIHVLAGGCACCEGREELLGLLRELSGSSVHRRDFGAPTHCSGDERPRRSAVHSRRHSIRPGALAMHGGKRGHRDR